MTGPHDRLRRARIEAGFETAAAARERFGWAVGTYPHNENGNASFSYKRAKEYAHAYGVRVEWLMDGIGPMRDGEEPMCRIIGAVGADPGGEVIQTTGQPALDMVPPPPGGSGDEVALEVRGHSMRGFADDGALVYISDQRTPPTPDMFNQVVLVETEDGRVLLKRLRRGSHSEVYDLESINGPPLEDQRLVWAAHVVAVIPPYHARRLIVRSAA